MRGTGGIYRAGVALLVCGLLACGGGSDNGEMDASTRDAQVVDGGVVLDGRVIDGSLPASDGGTQDGAVNVPDATSSNMECADHHACKQGEFCHRGKCRLDAEPVYHCGKPGCPPGHWCVEADGKRATCANDPTYGCESACDCGPAHCCIDDDGDGKKSCVKDEGDPWLGTPGAPSLCPSGPDVPEAEREPTYCASAAECIVGQQNWAQSGRRGTFLAYDENAPAGEEPVRSCGKQGCYATACNCSPGQSCVDTVEVDVTTPGSTCGLFSSGTCVSHAAAESLYDFAPGELLECCSDTCTPGQACDMGWMHSGNKLAYQRITATCPGNTPCVCGDGTCCPEEIRACPQDCMPTNFTVANDGSQTPGAPIECGNGVCEHFEDNARCPADCPEACGDGECDYTETVDTCFTDCREECGDGWCSPTERVQGNCPSDCDNRCIDANFYSRVYRVCGDGVCDRTSTCDMQEPETCSTCALDCGACDWEIVETGREGTVFGELYDVWVNAPDDVYAISWSHAFHFDGVGWTDFDLRFLDTGRLRGISSRGRRHAIVSADNGIFEFDGFTWSSADAPQGVIFQAAQQTATGQLIAAGEEDIYRRDDGLWSPEAVPPTGRSLRDLLVLEPEVYGVTGNDTLLHFDGSSWTSVVPVADENLVAITGNFADDIFAVGYLITGPMMANTEPPSRASVVHFDGASWNDIHPNATRMVDAWSPRRGEVFALDRDGTIWHRDGGQWESFPPTAPFDARALHGRSSNDVYGVGSDGKDAVIYHFDGTSWSALAVTSPENSFNDVWGTTAENLYLGGTGSVFYYNGSTVEQTALTSRYNGKIRANAVWGSATGSLVVVGDVIDTVIGEPPRVASTAWQYEQGSWKELRLRGHYVEVGGVSQSEVYLLSVANSLVDPFHAYYDGRGWKESPFPSDMPTPTSIWVAGSGDVFFGSSSFIYRCTSSPCVDPANFERTVVNGNIQAIWGIDNSNIFALGGDGTVLRFDGDLWSPVGLLGAGITDISGRTPTDVFAVGTNGKIFKFDGSTWSIAQADLRRPGYGTCSNIRATVNTQGTIYAVGAQDLFIKNTP